MKVCFTGHRHIPDLSKTLEATIINFIENGTTDFYAGGAVGFDMLCEQTVIKLREQYPQIKLHLVLPCPENEQTDGWSDEDKAVFHRILLSADDVEYVSEHFDRCCMKKRNARLIELSDCCICYYKYNRSGTGQTVRMAEKKGIEIINLG